jgi:hypothetical protein
MNVFGDFDKIHSVLKHDFHSVLFKVRSEAAAVKDELLTFCGVTYVMHGDVTVTQKDRNYTGTIESPLVWDDTFRQLPAFALNPLPFDTSAGHIEDTDSLLKVFALVHPLIDVVDLAGMCYGPFADSVPEIMPASIKLLRLEESDSQLN